jgi:hypothetical protein
MQQPTILRFTTDDFMEDLQRRLASDPSKVRGLLAVPETWRGIQTPARTSNPAAGRIGLLRRLGVAARRSTSTITARAQAHSSAAKLPLKLYQPAHQRFYLVGSTLVCQQPGLPDRLIEKGNEERASFVLRRFFPPAPTKPDDNLPEFNEATWTECAFVAQSDGTLAWQEVAAAGSADTLRRVVLSEEERLPLFPMNFVEDNQRPRRMLAGLIPVGRREAYQAAARKAADGSPAGGGSTDGTALLVLFRKMVAEPWKALVEQARAVSKFQTIPDPTAFDEAPDSDELKQTVREARATIQLGSWLVLADLASFLETYLPTVHAAVRDNTSSLSGNSGEVLRVLRQTDVGSPLKDQLNPSVTPAVDVVASNLADALQRFIEDSAVLEKLEAAEKTFTWPSAPTTNPVTANPDYPQFLFPLADPDLLSEAAEPDFTGVSTPPSGAFGDPTEADSSSDTFDVRKAKIDSFAALAVRAIEDVPGAPQPAVPTAAERPADSRPGWYVIRCVYERPACGELHEDVVSGATERFQLAGFFDPDAPARPIRIGLPVDTTPAGLRKFDKNTAFVMSDVLCGQIARLRGLTFGDLIRSVLPWPLHKDLSVPDGGPCKQGASGPNVGLICSLSIPIITICALLLLMIMISLLDIIFRWIPFFIVCFPLPGLRAKPK